MFDIKKHNVLGLSIEECIKNFGRSSLIYVGTWDIGYGVPSAVFYDAKPNREKNHKDFVILSRNNNDGALLVSNLDWKDMERYRKIDAIRCKYCEELIYSTHRHHRNECGCGKSFIDGGSSGYILCDVGSELMKIDMLAKFEKKEDED